MKRSLRSARQKELKLESLESRQLLAANPVITEFMASNNNALDDGDGNSSDWIEIHNAGDMAVNLAGYHLTDTPDNLTRWTFPTVLLNPGDYLVVFASGQDAANHVDGEGNLHTNFRLSAGGEYLGLVSPEGSVVSQFGTSSSEYPPQVSDVSYGFSQAATLVHANSESMFWPPLDDSLGSGWTEPGFDAAANGFSVGTGALGFESRPNDRTNFTNEIQTPLREGTHAVYVRFQFDLLDASQVRALKLRLKYDNGFIAYLNGVKVAQDNAPANVSWFSTAPNNSPRDRDAILFAEFDLSEHASQLVDGPNVLAIHGLNNFSDNTDMLLVTELIADRPLSQSAVGYLPTPTPGAANFALGALTGPLITEVTESPGALADERDLVVTAKMQPLNAAVQSASLTYRVMFDSEIMVPMVDDATGGDAMAGDGVFTATIPASASMPGQMLRWRVTAQDVEGNASHEPLHLDQEGTRQSPEYFGTVIADSALASGLPIFQWFAENARSAHTRRGARVSVFYDGEFYDNAFARQRGGATNATVSQKFVSNRGHEFRINDELGRVLEFNMNGEGSDNTYVRQTLAHDAYRDAGNASSVSFFTHMLVNGEFDRVGVFIEQVDEGFLERNGLDPDGALYKFVQRSNLNPVFNDTRVGVEKKTQLDEDLSDLQALVDGLHLPTQEEIRAFLFDNIDIPQLMNYLAVRSVTLEADDVRKNFYMYRDTFGTGEWSIYPWDKDWTFGVEGDGGPGLRSPFFGDFEHRKPNGNQWNVLYDVVFADPVTREMMLRRLRTVMDQLLKPPGTPAEELHFEPQLDELFAPAAPLLPDSVARAVENLKQEGRRGFFDRRRTDLYVNHSINNPDFRDNAGIPDAQVGNPVITFGAIEFEPASGIQDEEYIELVNPNHAAVDISGWQLSGGVQFTFKPGTVIPAGGSLYVSPSVNVFRARTSGPSAGQGLLIQGNYDGHLSAEGETVSLVAADGSVVGRVSVGGIANVLEQFLRVTEVNYHPHAPNPIPGLGELDDGSPAASDRFEYVELSNTGAETLDLAGVHFTAGIEFTFTPATMLQPGQRILVVKDQAAFESRYGGGMNVAGQFTGTLADDGENIFLDSADSRAIQSFTYGSGLGWPSRPAGRGSSLEVIDAEGNLNTPANWRASTEFGGSPGREGSQVSDPVIINEVLANSTAAQGDMLELRNASGTAVDIGNWYLSNSADDYFKFQVPPGTTLLARAYHVFDQTQFGFDFDRARGGDAFLIAADAKGKPLRFVDHIQFGVSVADVSLGPWPTSRDAWIMLAEPTFGGANARPYVGEVLISEVYYSPLDPDGRGRLRPDNFEFIELYNRTDVPVDVSGWELAGDVQFELPAATVIGAGEALTLVAFDPNDAAPANVFRFSLGMDASAAMAGPYSDPLDDGGGTLRLIRSEIPPDDDPTFTPVIVVDEVTFSSEPPWPLGAAGSGDALARTEPTVLGNLVSSWRGAAPTPGTVEFVARLPGDANEDGLFNQLDIVQILQAGKFMTGEPASWAEGDWTGDGLFDQLDLVEALQAGGPLQQNARQARARTNTPGEVDVLDALFGL